MIVSEILKKEELSRDDIIKLLSSDTAEDIELIRFSAYRTMCNYVGEKVYLRGLVEFSNYCTNDCQYCGIRKSNDLVTRYILEKDEVVAAAKWSADQGYASFVLQSGERDDTKFIDYVCDVVSRIKSETISEKHPNGLGITLCVGEQTKETYQRFYDAGAHRYLLRIETSNEKLYKKLHTVKQSFTHRVNCLSYLKDIGFQVGTGVMIAFPGQTVEDLADDILFFKKMDIDMIGMGPFIVHRDTPMADFYDEYLHSKLYVYKMALKMIAVTRIFLKDVNIASTTALQAMYPLGREVGLSYGANIVMPQVTPTAVRKNYQLYEGKPCLDEMANDCKFCVEQKITAGGRQIGFDEWGDSRHYMNKVR